MRITKKQLADYLGVTASAVSQYDKRKVYLMLKGLQKIKEEKEQRQNKKGE